MSYILEALKKAQAERQLGSAPTIHAAQPLPAVQAARAGSRMPLLAGAGVGVLVVVAGALFLWRSGSGPAQPAAAVVLNAPAAPPLPAPPAPPAASLAPGVATTLDVNAPPAPVHVAPAPAEPAARAGRTASSATAAPTTAAAAPAAAAPAAAAPAAAAPAVPVRPPNADDNLPLLQQLPDAMQREVPRVAFGGYMYSANPADRLLLVDKTLRHEGEEVAPGLVLEKLLPKAAVMNYHGVRYRVGL